MKKFYLLSILFLLSGVEHLRAQWIQPAQYQEMLGSGVDVDWWTNESDYSDLDWQNTITDFNDAGIQHVRITISRDVMTPDDYLLLDHQVNLCLHRGIVPIIAYKPRLIPGYDKHFYHRHITDWWGAMAHHYANFPARLSFDILIEPNSNYFDSYDALNDFYEDCVATIRLTNPHRILFIAPTYNSDPLYLQYLRIPSRANGYLMAEWHFLNEANRAQALYNWQHRQNFQRHWINQRIEAALSWQRRTGILTWVGGWGGYYGSNYGEIQLAYVDFLSSALIRANIPYAFRGVNHFYDYRSRQWHNYTYNPIPRVFPRGNFAHSGMYAGRAHGQGGFSIGGHRFNGQPQHRYDNRSGYRGNYNNGNGRGFSIGGERQQHNYNGNNRNNVRIQSGQGNNQSFAHRGTVDNKNTYQSQRQNQNNDNANNFRRGQSQQNTSRNQQNVNRSSGNTVQRQSPSSRKQPIVQSSPSTQRKAQAQTQTPKQNKNSSTQRRGGGGFSRSGQTQNL